MELIGSVAYVVDHCAVPAAGHLINEEQANIIAADVRSILRDDTGVQEAREALADLAKTNFGSETLERVLAAPESFDEWRVGEALAELHLATDKGCVFPWGVGKWTNLVTNTLQNMQNVTLGAPS